MVSSKGASGFPGLPGGVGPAGSPVSCTAGDKFRDETIRSSLLYQCIVAGFRVLLVQMDQLASQESRVHLVSEGRMVLQDIRGKEDLQAPREPLEIRVTRERMAPRCAAERATANSST